LESQEKTQIVAEQSFINSLLRQADGAAPFDCHLELVGRRLKVQRNTEQALNEMLDCFPRLFINLNLTQFLFHLKPRLSLFVKLTLNFMSWKKGF